ncbi:hypothetical protein SAMN05421848_2149 [Kushneria avicenniae]|uniref:Uncharacterized protein n=1 Tax=Kushneria avicenniae TaxID=402385 RepID=A0A1I1KRP8_9GAMM|nr:hypothetical protein SAMN05421848_2149 [Kushneria avicenniae]
MDGATQESPNHNTGFGALGIGRIRFLRMDDANGFGPTDRLKDAGCKGGPTGPPFLCPNIFYAQTSGPVIEETGAGVSGQQRLYRVNKRQEGRGASGPGSGISA